ncbi:type I restriction endonuclease subunit R, partial [Escherichia coli]|nr:type I restriction endonuclease subunit R [Escherichia coli]
VNEDNPNIITTKKELELFERIKQIIQTEDNIEYKDTESYFGILLDGKSNRWILRFYDKKSSFILLPISFNEIQLNEIKRARLETDGRKIHITNPEDILRISGLILDAFEYVKNDDNFRRGTKTTLSENIE